VAGHRDTRRLNLTFATCRLQGLDAELAERDLVAPLARRGRSGGAAYGCLTRRGTAWLSSPLPAPSGGGGSGSLGRAGAIAEVGLDGDRARRDGRWAGRTTVRRPPPPRRRHRDRRQLPRPRRALRLGSRCACRSRRPCDPHLHAGCGRRWCGPRRSESMFRAQRVQRDPTLAVELRARHLGPPDDRSTAPGCLAPAFVADCSALRIARRNATRLASCSRRLAPAELDLGVLHLRMFSSPACRSAFPRRVRMLSASAPRRPMTMRGAVWMSTRTRSRVRSISPWRCRPAHALESMRRIASPRRRSRVQLSAYQRLLNSLVIPSRNPCG